MGALNLTEEQKKIIDLRDSSILVSAAAGSGKTAVLVERIMSKIMDKENPKDIDEFLVVTFTKAAAAQMREKLAKKISKALEAEPDNSHLIKQITLVNRADITTIDSFCLKLVKENFSMLDVDSSFNIGDAGMIELMKNEVMTDMLEEKYSEKSYENKTSFFDLVDIFCNDKDDTGLQDEILKIYNIAATYPKPENWLKNARAVLEIEDRDKVVELPWVKKLTDIIKNKLKSAVALNEIGEDICAMPGGPDKNLTLVSEDKDMLMLAIEKESYEDLKSALQISFGRLKTCKGEIYDQELVEQFKAIRNSYKKIVKECYELMATPDVLLDELKQMSKYLVPLIELVEEFSKRFSDIKKQRRLMEFSDIEHMAYNLVCAGYKDGIAYPTVVGEEIGKKYAEIYIDEYQDSNFLQEDILCSVSGYSKGIYNMFMVGDVKQSIYRFRMARPDLFIGKYNRFGEEGNEIKIELRKNFRSRSRVLNSINYFFYQLMGSDLGDIEYSESIALASSEKYEEYDSLVTDEKIKNTLEAKTEVLLVDAKQQEDFENVLTDEEKNMAKLQLEASVISSKIKELLYGENPQYIYDEEKELMRRARYSDIVILGRSIKGFGDIVYNTLMADGIPAYIEDPKGYFDAVEIRITLALLSVVDNSYQDIPMAAVLLSPIAGLNENDLAIICNYITTSYGNKLSLYEQCELYVEEFSDELAVKLRNFLRILSELKNAKANMSISELIWKALKDTGYYSYAIAMPAGNKRKANLNMLLEKADKFEKGYYKGLFNFLRYIEKMKLNDVDFGEANILGDEDDVVRIISMHKSKGLEYPIVFVSGLGKQFNIQERKNNLIVHSDYYLASMLVDNNNRFKRNSYIRDSFRTILKAESMSEELRILYVAMTRAKERLFLTGCELDMEKIEEKYNYIKSRDEILLPYDVRLDASSFMRWIMAASIRDKIKPGNIFGEDVLKKTIYSYENVVSSMGKSATDQSYEVTRIEELLRTNSEASSDMYDSMFKYEYPYSKCIELSGKMSISDIKRMKAWDGVQYEYQDYTHTKKAAGKKDTEITGAQRGTIVHKFMELFEFKKLIEYVNIDNCSLDACNIDKVKSFIMEAKNIMLHKGIFTKEEVEVIDIEKITSMVTSNLGVRMIAADTRNELFKEQQFSIGIPVSDIFDIGASEDKVIVQGIIDGFFYENDAIVVMDYKTDYADEEKLIGSYKAQLDYYGRTLEQLTGKRVSQKIIYSFHLNKEIEL